MDTVWILVVGAVAMRVVWTNGKPKGTNKDTRRGVILLIGVILGFVFLLIQ